MIDITLGSRQPLRLPWTLERLNLERSILLRLAIDESTALSYSSALNSYITFCKLHHLPIEPTANMLSYYVTYQSSFISPSSVNSYLSGICNQLEPWFPSVHANRTSQLVARTLKGARRRHGTTPLRKDPLSWDHLCQVHTKYATSLLHDDFLFEAILSTGFCALLRLAELVVSDNKRLRNLTKSPLRSSCSLEDDRYTFWLPVHKSDTLFEGNRVVVLKRDGTPDPHTIMRRYLTSRDKCFPLHPNLWLCESGTVPTRAWFISRLRSFFPPTISGHSMRAGGATAMAEGGASPDLIKAAGRWSSNAFERYIRKNPFVLHALILGRTSASRTLP
jgi:hypothetical protein